MRKGITLIELLLVISIITILAASSIPSGSAFLVRNNLKNKTNELVSSLNTAKFNATSGKEDSVWGVNVTQNNIIVFKGNSYAERDSAFDQTYDIPSSISITQLERTFDRLTGNPNLIASITLTSNSGDSYTVTINEAGAIDINK